MSKQDRLFLSILALSVLLPLSVYLGLSFSVEATSFINVYGEPRNSYPTAAASLFGYDLTDRITWNDETDYTTPGTYELIGEVTVFGMKKQVTLPSLVLDMEAPTLTVDEAIIFTRVGEPWTLPSYEVTDNYDLPEAITVTMGMEGESVPTTEGLAETFLRACDTSGNCTQRSVSAMVGSAREEDFLPGSFDLYALDTHEVLLKPGETPVSDAIFSELYWIGDSNILNLGLYGGLPSSRVIARYAMGPMTFDLPIYYRNVLQNKTTEELTKEIQPERVILMMGEAEAGSGDPLALTEAYGQCIDRLHSVSPSTEIIVGSILPIR